MDVTAAAMAKEAASLARQGRVTEAILAYQRALGRRPDSPNSWYNLALLQREAGQFEQALASYQQALERGIERPEEVHLNRGVIYADHLRRHDAAEREYRSALALNPVYIPALLNLGNLCEDLGLREAARDSYQSILEIDARHWQALARVANLQMVSDPGDPLVQRLRAALDQSSATTAADRADLGFALGRLLDGCGAYAEAFEAYRAANRHSRACAPPGAAVYDRATEERFMDRLIAASPARDSAAAHPGTSAPAGPAAPHAALPPPVPIFICGMFRSGSTLIEQVLGRHPRVSAGGELDLIPRIAREVLTPFPESLADVSTERLRSLALDYVRFLTTTFPGAQFVTDKRPDNFLYVGLIKMLFPAAKIVHTTRNPLDNCLSIFFLHLDQRLSYALDLMDTGHHYRQYLRLMTHWQALYGADIVDVDYDAFVHEPKPQAERLLAFLGLEPDDRCLAPSPAGHAIKTASVWQAREPIYQRSSGRARHYRRESAELRKYLAGTQTSAAGRTST